MKGLIAYSFALGEHEPNPCNMRLACAVDRIVKEERERGEEVVVVAQWEIALALSVEPDFVVHEHRQGDMYLDSEEITSQATPLFLRHGITKVIPVANPFLHLFKCKKLIRRAGFVSLSRRVGWVGFYKNSLQWYTRGPIRLLAYAALQFLFGYHGKVIRKQS